MFVYAAGGYYYPGKDNNALYAEMRGYLDRGYKVVKMKIGGASIDEDRVRIEAVLKEIGRRRSLPWMRMVASIWRPASLTRRCCASIHCSGTRKRRSSRLPLQAAVAQFYPGPMATGENLSHHQDARNLLRYGGMRPDRD